VLLAISEEAKTSISFSRYNKTIIRFGFCDIQNNQGQELFWISQKSHHIHVKNPLSGNMNTRLRMYKVLLFKFRSHLCKVSISRQAKHLAIYQYM